MLERWRPIVLTSPGFVLALLFGGLILPVGGVTAGPATSAPTSQPAAEPATRPHGRLMRERVPADFVQHEISPDGHAILNEHGMPNEHASLKVPPNWKVLQPHGNATLAVLCDDGVSNVNVVVIGSSPEDDPAVIAPIIIKSLEGQMKNFALKKSEIVDVDYVPSVRLVYDADTQGGRLRFQQTFIPQLMHGYIITYTAPPDHYEGNAKAVDQIVSSYYLQR